MFDLAKGIEYKDLKPKIYKGHTTIELKNVKTGIRDRIESDNTFQSDVLAKFLRSFGAYNNNPYNNSTWRSRALWTRLVGGIYLFRDAISTLTDYMPAGNLMVANGSYMVTNTSTVELGSYNDRESVISANSLSMVYDWTTSQGNGIISSVCLGSDVGGYIGYGNKAGEIVTGKALNENQTSENLNGLIYKNNLYNFEIDDTNRVLTVKKKKTVVTAASIFDGIETSTDYSYSASIAFESNPSVCACYMGGGKIAVFYGNPYNTSISPNSELKFIVFDVENNSVSVKTITNITQDSWWVFNQGILNVAFNDDSIFIPKVTSGYVRSTFPIYEFNINTGALSHTYNGSDQILGYQICKFTPDLMAFSGNIIDTINKTVYPANLTDQGLGFIDDTDSLRTGSLNSGLYKNPMYLATINNLDSQVEKTSSQTMKVIYTLTEAV